MGAFSDDSDFRDRQRARLAESVREFNEWFEGLPDREQEFLRRSGIEDFESRSSSQTILLSDLSEDPIARLEIQAMHTRHPNGRDFEAEFLDMIDPSPRPELPEHCAETVQDAISTIVAEVLSLAMDEARSALLALCVACGWGKADGLTVDAAARRGKVSRNAMRTQVERWRELLGLRGLSGKIIGAIHVMLDEVLCCGNAVIALASLAIAAGCAERLGYTTTEMARRCGCSRQNLSKEVVAWRERLGLSSRLGGGKSDAAREGFRRAQIARSWRRDPVRLAAQD